MDSNLKRNTLMKGGCPLHYYTSTPKEDAINMVCIHGSGCDHNSFSKMIEELKDHYNLLTVDLRGQGKSQPTNQKITFELMIEDILDVLNDASIEKAVFIGQGLGGAIVQEIAFRNPNMVEGLGIIAASCNFGKFGMVERISYHIMNMVVATYPYNKIRKNLSFSNASTVEGREYTHKCISKMKKENLIAGLKSAVECFHHEEEFVHQVNGFVALGVREAGNYNKKILDSYKKHLPNCDVYRITNASAMVQYDGPSQIADLIERMRLKTYSKDEYQLVMDKFKKDYEKEVKKMQEKQQKEAQAAERKREQEKAERKSKRKFLK